jgi:sulfoxide reductase catalytic subunit YedY
MIFRRTGDIPSSEITPREHYFSRRTFLRAVGLGGSLAATAGLTGWLADPGPSPYQHTRAAADEADVSSESDDSPTPRETVTHYNNYYEFSTDKAEVAELAKGFEPRPWTVQVDGLVRYPKTYGIDEFLKLAPAEERVYRHRCVEGWSMVVPWLGFSLAAVLKAAEPLSGAKYVAFTSLKDPARMPGQKGEVLMWPYVEGLRLDEAMHPLVLLAQGIYGEALLPQNGAPLRLVVPWKYGFKGIKAIVRISAVAEEPGTSWSRYAAREYGFYSNVNPLVRHPRWSQEFEERLGPVVDRRRTLMFNGYGEKVASLYAGMDLAKHF